MCPVFKMCITLEAMSSAMCIALVCYFPSIQNMYHIQSLHLSALFQKCVSHFPLRTVICLILKPLPISKYHLFITWILFKASSSFIVVTDLRICVTDSLITFGIGIGEHGGVGVPREPAPLRVRVVLDGASSDRRYEIIASRPGNEWPFIHDRHG